MATILLAHKFHDRDFKRIFGKEVKEFTDIPLSVATNSLQFDIIKFDDYLIETYNREYKDSVIKVGGKWTEDASCKDFVLYKFGQEGLDIILKLINDFK